MTRRITWTAFLIGVAVIALLLLPQTGKARYGQSLNRCYRQMHRLSAGILAYQEENGHFPPPFISDAAGTPIHSWRVLILPYIGEKELYEQYRFDEPWDSPHNSQLASRMPSVYRCPDSGAQDHYTIYLAVTGTQTVWDHLKEISNNDVSDGIYDTVLLSEYAQAPVRWMEPKDLAYEAVIQDAIIPQSRHDDSDFVIAYADGYVEVIDSLPTSLFQKMLTIDGGEPIDESLIDIR